MARLKKMLKIIKYLVIFYGILAGLMYAIAFTIEAPSADIREGWGLTKDK